MTSWKRPRNLAELIDRVEPALRLYESLVPFGIDRFMPMILQEFDRRQKMEDGIERRSKLWDLKWVRYAAIATTIYLLIAALEFALVIWNTISIHGGK